jgi:hypothetical protein
MKCGQCGTPLSGEDQFCGDCGAAVTEVAASAVVSAIAPVSSAGRDDTVRAPLQFTIPDHWRTGIWIDRHPLELWIVIGLFAVPGAYLAITGLDALTNAFDLFSFSSRLALLLVLIALLVISIGGAFMGIAWMLFVRSRVGRGLAYVVAAMALLSVIVSGDSGDAYRSAGLIALGALAAIVLLGLAPAVREVFTGPGAPAADDPTSVVIARVCIAAAVWGNGVIGLVLLLLGDVDSSYYVYGVLEIGVAGLLFHVFTRLRGPDRQARLIASGAAAVGIVASLHGPGLDGAALGVVGPAAVLVCLWIAPDSRTWFGDEPISISMER